MNSNQNKNIMFMSCEFFDRKILSDVLGNSDLLCDSIYDSGECNRAHTITVLSFLVFLDAEAYL